VLLDQWSGNQFGPGDEKRGVKPPYKEDIMKNVRTSVKECLSEKQMGRSIYSCVLLNRKGGNLEFCAAGHPRGEVINHLSRPVNVIVHSRLWG
jgi:hypothetical protein